MFPKFLIVTNDLKKNGEKQTMGVIKDIFDKIIDTSDLVREAYVKMSEAVKRGGVVRVRLTSNISATREGIIEDAHMVYYGYDYLQKKFKIEKLRLLITEQSN